MSKKIFFFIIVLVFYFLFILYSDFTKFSENFLDLQFEFLPLILLGSFTEMIIKGLRQHIMLKEINVRLSIKNSILLYLAGSSMTVTPGGSGTIIKSYFLKKKYGIKISNTLPLIILEKFHDLLAIISIISITLLIIPINEIKILVTFVFIFLLFGFIAFRSQKFFKLLRKIFKKLPKINSFVDSVDESYKGFQSLTQSKITIKNWALSIFSWSIDAIVIYFVFISFGLDVNIIFTTLVIHSSFLIGNIAIIPAGLGVTEVSAVGFLLNEGIELSLATSIIVVIRLVTTWFATGVGLIATHIYLK